MSSEQPIRRDERDGPLSASERTLRGNEGNATVSELKPSNSRFSNLFEQAPCPYLALDLDGTCAKVNEAFVRLCGRPLDDIYATRFQRFLTSAGAIFYETQVLPTLHLRGRRNEVALDIVDDSGRRRPVLANFSMQYDSTQQPCGILIVLMEAAERRLFERDLLQSRREAEQIAEVVLHSSDAIIALSTVDIIQSWNNGAEQMFGYPADDAIGMHFADLLLPRELRTEFEDAKVVVEKGQVFSKGMTAFHKDRRTVNVAVTLTPHMEAPGILVAYSAIIRDDSARQIAERALVQSEKLAAVGRLASAIAHEINNPLASVTNLIYLASLNSVDPEQKLYLAAADEELRRVSVVASQTLRFHRQLSKPQLVTCDGLFSSLLMAYQGRLRNASISVERRKRAQQAIVCFEGDVRQVLSNLLTNALDAMQTGGRLLLRSREGTDWRSGQHGIFLTLADTGTGMSLSTQSHLFEAFFTTKGIGGTGLGLWISADIMERHRGRIFLRSSQREGHRGTVTSVFLPFGKSSVESEDLAAAHPT
jgi:PAS domain S-box-containing protein